MDRDWARAVGRKAFHVFNATWGVLAYHLVVPRTLAAAAIGFVTLVVGVIEVLRLRGARFNREIMAHPLFGRMIRPSEVARVSGAFYFVLGVFLAIALFPRPVTEAACLAMGYGDAAAAVVGQRLGRHRVRGGRSLEGSAAYAVAAFAVVVVFRLAFYGGLAAAVAWAAVAGLVAAATELVSVRVDDNLTVPLMTGTALFLLVA